jgi:hypothetical protein
MRPSESSTVAFAGLPSKPTTEGPGLATAGFRGGFIEV